MPPHDVTPIDGSGSGTSGTCDELASDLQRLESSLALLQHTLDTTPGPSGPGTDRDRLRNTIDLITAEISVVEARQLAAGCVGSVVPRQCSHVFDSPIYGRITINGVICTKWKSLDSATTAK